METSKRLLVAAKIVVGVQQHWAFYERVDPVRVIVTVIMSVRSSRARQSIDSLTMVDRWLILSPVLLKAIYHGILCMR